MARKHSEKGTEEHLNLQCKQCTEEQEAKVDGTGKRFPQFGVYRDTANSGKPEKGANRGVKEQ